MDPALQRRVQRYGWDKASTLYEDYWQRQLAPAQGILLEMAGLKPADKVLDVACGTGLVSFMARDQVGEEGSVTGTDISEKMIELCRARAGRRHIENVRFERMDGEELALEEKSFDRALCALGLMYMPEPVKALSEMQRLLKPGGLAVAAVWGRREHCGWSSLFGIVEKHVASDVCPLFFNLGNPDMLRLSFEAAGFQSVATRSISTVLSFENAAEACGAAFAGGPVALVYHKFSDEVKQEVHQEYLESVSAYARDGRYEIPGEFVIASGIA